MNWAWTIGILPFTIVIAMYITIVQLGIHKPGRTRHGESPDVKNVWLASLASRWAQDMADGSVMEMLGMLATAILTPNNNYFKEWIEKYFFKRIGYWILLILKKLNSFGHFDHPLEFFWDIFRMYLWWTSRCYSWSNGDEIYVNHMRCL